MNPSFPSSSNSQSLARFQRFLRKDVLIPKIITDVPLLAMHGIMDIFECQGWRNLLIDEKPIYPWLVRQFYANLSFSQKNQTLRTFVKDKEIILDNVLLARILNIPHNGWEIQSFVSWSNYPLSPLEQTRIFMANNLIGEPYIPLIDQVPTFSRIIFHLCFYNLFPRDPDYLRIDHPDMFFVSMMLSRKPINLPGIILCFMSYVALREASLPYGGILTHIFEYFGVDLTGDEILLRQPFPSTILDGLYFVTLDEGAQSKSQGKQLVEMPETTGTQNPIQSFDMVSEVSGQKQGQCMDKPSKPHSLENVYSLLKDINARLGGMETQLVILRERQAKNTQTLDDLLAFVSKVFYKS